MNLKYASFIAMFLVFLSCEERSVVIPDFVAPETDRVLLIEELTGVSCPNCPSGAAEIRSLQEAFGDNLVAVSYYTNFLGFPRSESKYDFRNAESQEIEERLGNYLGKPASTFNRVFQDDFTRFNSLVPEWRRLVEEQLEGFSPVLITGNSNYDGNSNSASIEITISPKEVFTGNHNLIVLISESHIEDAQLHPGNVVVEDYEHNHVFRRLLTEISGLSLPPTVASPEQLIYDFDFDLDEEWVGENVEIVAFIEEQDNGTPKQVIQAFKMKLIQ